jgi:hypothetical protein
MYGYGTGCFSAGEPAASPSNVDRAGLNGASFSLDTWLLVACGTGSSFLFTATYPIEGAPRPGYGAWQQAISALSLGPGG